MNETESCAVYRHTASILDGTEWDCMWYDGNKVVSDTDAMKEYARQNALGEQYVLDLMARGSVRVVSVATETVDGDDLLDVINSSLNPYKSEDFALLSSAELVEHLNTVRIGDWLVENSRLIGSGASGYLTKHISDLADELIARRFI